MIDSVGFRCWALIAVAAELAGKSLNALSEEALKKAAGLGEFDIKFWADNPAGWYKFSMGKTIKTGRSALTGKFVTKPIGPRKAAKFAAVESIEVKAASREISQRAKAGGLQGEAYRAEIVRAFKKR